jgi:hypothetical protein
MALGEIGWSGTDLIDMALLKDQWKALVFVVIKLRLP